MTVKERCEAQRKLYEYAFSLGLFEMAERMFPNPPLTYNDVIKDSPIGNAREGGLN